jgi:hypothetical protein
MQPTVPDQQQWTIARPWDQTRRPPPRWETARVFFCIFVWFFYFVSVKVRSCWWLVKTVHNTIHRTQYSVLSTHYYTVLYRTTQNYTALHITRYRVLPTLQYKLQTGHHTVGIVQSTRTWSSRLHFVSFIPSGFRNSSLLTYKFEEKNFTSVALKN